MVKNFWLKLIVALSITLGAFIHSGSRIFAEQYFSKAISIELPDGWKDGATHQIRNVIKHFDLRLPNDKCLLYIAIRQANGRTAEETREAARKSFVAGIYKLFYDGGQESIFHSRAVIGNSWDHRRYDTIYSPIKNGLFIKIDIVHDNEGDKPCVYREQMRKVLQSLKSSEPSEQELISDQILRDYLKTYADL